MNELKIGFDAKRITHNATGLGNYGRFVVNGLSKFYPENRYILYSPNEGNKQLRKRVNSNDSISYRYPTGVSKYFPSLWRSYNIINELKKDNLSVFHGLSNELPLNIKKSGIQSVVTIHDLIFIRYPYLYKAIDRGIYNHKFKQACIQSDKIIAVSQQTKEDIISFFHIKPDKIEVQYQGCDPLFYQAVHENEKDGIKDKYNILKHYILYVGSIEERKNLLLLVKAFKDLGEDIELIVVGKYTRYADLVKAFIQENNLTEQVRIFQNVPFADLPALYQMADVFVYPSFFEGFGIPVLEALASNTPVIAATGSSLEEAGGPGSLYTNPNNEYELREMIKSVLLNPGLADSMRRQGYEYAKRFDSKILASQLIDLYKRLL